MVDVSPLYEPDRHLSSLEPVFLFQRDHDAPGCFRNVGLPAGLGGAHEHLRASIPIGPGLPELLQVRDELRAAVDQAPASKYPAGFAPSPTAQVEALREVSMYQVDPTVRRAEALQLTRTGLEIAAEIRP